MAAGLGPLYTDVHMATRFEPYSPAAFCDAGYQPQLYHPC